MKKPRQVKVELNFTKDLKDRMIVFVPHDLRIDELPLTQEKLVASILGIVEKDVSKTSGTASARDVDKETSNENTNTGETGRKKAKA
jgi:hypothetical protein